MAPRLQFNRPRDLRIIDREHPLLSSSSSIEYNSLVQVLLSIEIVIAVVACYLLCEEHLIGSKAFVVLEGSPFLQPSYTLIRIIQTNNSSF